MSIGRREFLTGLGAFGVGMGIGAVSHVFPLASPHVGPDWSPGDESYRPSTCLLCPARCGILGRVVDGKLVRIDGNPLHPVSRGGLCPKGRAGIQLLYHPRRLRGPQQRSGGEGGGFEPVAWEAALERVGGELRRIREKGGAGRVAIVAGHVTGIMRELLEKFAAAYGARLFLEDYGDGSEQVLELTQGTAVLPAFDLERADVVLSFGAALGESWWCPPQAARARAHDRKRPRWIQVDTRLSRTAVASDEWLPIRPGTYGDLALGIAYVLLKEGLYDESAVHRAVSGFESWTDERGRRYPGFRSIVLEHGRTERVAEKTGLPAERIIAVAKQFGSAERAVAVWDHNVTWQAGGLAQALAIHALNVIRGSVGRRGGVIVRPPLPAPAIDGGPSNPEVAPPPQDWVAELESAKEPPEAIFFYYANPAASHPEPERVAKLLARVPLVVSFSPFLDETARLAHVVLPDHIYLERWQDAPAPATVPYTAWGVVQPLVEPRHDTRATGDVLLDLAARAGEDVSRALPKGPMEALVRTRGKALASVQRGSPFVPAFRQAELAELEARGWWIPHGLDPDRFWEAVLSSGGWFDPFVEEASPREMSELPDGKLAILSPEARRRLSGTAGAPEWLALPGKRPAQPAKESTEYPLRLMPYRLLTLSSGTTTLTPWLLERQEPLVGAAWEVWIEINPETAREFRVRDREEVKVVSPRGSFRARVHVFDGAQPGVVNVPYGLHMGVDGWGRLDPVNPLVAAGSARDEASGLPDWFSARVRLERA
ncbi:MAG: hypothetical protein D6718_09650 [Acidobacteria bacterium]|nr:MAG: hypothetical protein D6718_09650 [Acidobacteriota bacterium]